MTCTPFVDSVGREGGWKRLSRRGLRRALTLSLDLDVYGKQAKDTAIYPVQAARRLTALLLHVWIDGGNMVWLQWCLRRGTRQGFWLEEEEGQILARRRSPSLSSLP